MSKIFLRTYFSLFILTFFSLKTTGQDIGYFIIESNLKEFLLVVDDDFKNYLEVTSGDTLALKPGERSLRMIAPNVKDNLFKTTIFADSIVGISIQFSQFNRNPRSSYSLITSENYNNFEIQTDYDSEIYVNDKLVSTGEYSDFLPPNTYKIDLIHPEFGTSSFKIEASLFEFNQISRFNEDPVSAPKVVQFIPGARYVLTKQYGKSAATYTSLLILGFGLNYLDDQFSSKKSDYDSTLRLYNSAESSADAIQYRNEILTIRDEMDDINLKTGVVISAIAMVSAFAVWDGFRKPKSGYVVIPPSRFQPKLALSQTDGINIITVGGMIALW